MAGMATTIGVVPRLVSGGSAATVPLGDYAGYVDPSGIRQFASQTATSPLYATDFLDGTDSWAQMDSAAGLGGWKGYRLVLAVPVIPGSSGGTLAQGAAGAYNQYFATLAQNLVGEGEANAILRLGWEFNGNWFPWTVATTTDAANFAAYWRQIVSTMRAVPGAQFSFLWNPNAGTSMPYTPEEAYPGDAYVDYVGVDLYDECWCTPQTPQNAWASYVSESWGLDWLTGFAASHGKPIAIPEWSVTIRNDGHGLGDDPYFVTQFANWVGSNNVAFTDIFSYNDTSGGQDNDITDGRFPNALAAFKQEFGGGAPLSPSTTSPPTTSPPTTSPPTTSAASTTTTTPSSPTSTTPSDPPTSPHVMVVVMENKNYSEVIGQTGSQPYTNTLAQTYGLATNSYGIAHPSLPNYLALVSGSTQGVTDDSAPSAHKFPGATTLANQLQAAGISAKAYAENLPANPSQDSGEYAVRHVPWEYFPSAPISVADASTMTADLDSASPPDFVWYTPNLIDDEHDGTVQQGDTFLSHFIPSVQSTAWYREGGRIIIEWDEAEDSDTSGINGGSGGHIPTIVVSDALGASPRQSATRVDSVGVLASIDSLYGLPALGASTADGSVNALLDVSQPPPTTTTTTTTRPPSTTTTTTTRPTTTMTTTTTTRPPSSTTTRPAVTTTTTRPAVTTTTTRPAVTTTTTRPTSPTSTPTTTLVSRPPPPSRTPTSVSLSLVPDATTSAQDLTAVVRPAPDAGSVEFMIDGADVGGLRVSQPGGSATVAFDLLAGAHQIDATYSGSDSFAPSDVSQQFTLEQSPSGMWVQAPVEVGTSGAFGLSATLTDIRGPIAGATVWFSVPGNALCSGVTDGTGHATCFVSPGDPGSSAVLSSGVTASFSGDASDLPVTANSPAGADVGEDVAAFVPGEGGDSQFGSGSGAVGLAGTSGPSTATAPAVLVSRRRTGPPDGSNMSGVSALLALAGVLIGAAVWRRARRRRPV